MTHILKDQPPTIYGDGEQSRDFTYIDNVVHANLLAARAPKTAGEAINIACGYSVTLNEVITLINQHLGKNVKPIYTDPRPGDVKHSLADIQKAKDLIGYQPVISFSDGLQKAISWYEKYLM